MSFFQRLAKFKFSLMFVILMTTVMIAYPRQPLVILGFLTATTIITLYVENKTEELE